MLETFKRTRMYTAIAVITLSAVSTGCTHNTNDPQNVRTATNITSEANSNAGTITASSNTSLFNVDYERFTLDNGLTVVLHVDRSDPVAAVALTAHVGSAREKEGRTGFAHLFEHLLFLESENLGKGGLDNALDIRFTLVQRLRRSRTNLAVSTVYRPKLDNGSIPVLLGFAPAKACHTGNHIPLIE